MKADVGIHRTCAAVADSFLTEDVAAISNDLTECNWDNEQHDHQGEQESQSHDSLLFSVR